MYFNVDHLIQIREKPHLLGQILGKSKLTQIHSDWIQYIWETEGQDRCLQAHRGSFKTTAIIVIGAIWWLLFHPNDRILVIRKKYSDSAEVLRTIKQLMSTNEAKELFKLAHGSVPFFRVKRDGKLEWSFKHTATPEGNLNAFGIDSGITGAHADKIICDDFATLKDRTSMAEREKTKSMIREIRTNIIDSGQNCGFIGTPWHKDDAWSILPTTIKFDVYDCNILNEKEIEAKQKSTLPSLFAANYLLKHQADEGKLFTDPIYKKWSYNIRKVSAHIDAAFDGNHTNGFTIMSNKSDGRLQAFGKTFEGNVKNWIDVLEAEYRKRKCMEILVENNADKGYTASLLRKRGMNVVEYVESQNKHVKITTHLYDRFRDIDWDPKSDEKYMEQIIDYEQGMEPDDCTDSAASLIRERFSMTTGGYEALYQR